MKTDTIVLSPVTDGRTPHCHNRRRIYGRAGACLHVFNGPCAGLGHHVKIIIYCTPGNDSLSTLHSGYGTTTTGMRICWCLMLVSVGWESKLFRIQAFYYSGNILP